MEFRCHCQQMISMWPEDGITGVLNLVASLRQSVQPKELVVMLQQPPKSLRVSLSVVDCNHLVIKTCARHLEAALTPG